MAMKGAGYYSKATTGARDAINAIAPRVLEAVGRMPITDDGTTFRAADIGSADGGTSVEMWGQVLSGIRAKLPTRPIEIVYTDLPRNDFSQLFRMLHGQTDIKSYYGEITEVYPFASGTSFHQSILPRESLDLGFSATATHYVSRVPVAIPDHVHMVGAKGAERAAFDEIGRIEWERFLLLRTRELKAGGRIALLNFGIDEKGRYLGQTGGVSMFDCFDRLWRGLAEEGVIRNEEYLATNFPQVYRTTEQFTAPLREATSPVHQAGLRLELVESRFTRCPYARDFESHRDPECFARAYIPTLRSWSEPTFASGLDPDRPPEQRQAILDEFYRRYQHLVAASPAGHGMDYIHIFMVCVKE